MHLLPAKVMAFLLKISAKVLYLESILLIPAHGYLPQIDFVVLTSIPRAKEGSLCSTPHVSEVHTVAGMMWICRLELHSSKDGRWKKSSHGCQSSAGLSSILACLSSG